MSVLAIVAIGVVGGIGAIARFALDSAVSARAGSAFPFGTLAVNLSGALLLGVLAGAAVDDVSYLIAGTGLVGAFTTFSTWALESHRLGEDGQLRLGILNFAISLVLGVACAWVGQQVGSAL